MPRTSGTGPSLPPEDRTLSPFTGYGRAHWLALADRLLTDAHRFASPSGARLVLPGRPSSSGTDSDQLEGFARTFLLLAFRTAGCAGQAPAGLLQRYAAGIGAGTDPGHSEAWPALGQECRQTLVEACSLALGLHLTRPWLWDQLPDGVQERVVTWLQGAWGLRIPDNNWHMFRVIVGEFLASVGAAHDRAAMDDDLARIEQFYVGDGWYRDGGDARTADNFDHYNGWALHTYPLLWSSMAGERATDRMDRTTLKARLRRFLTDYALFFGADGAPVHQGRSLIYRFAAATAPWLGALVDATPLGPGQTRRLASGALRHFTDRGFRDRNGIPTLGWYGPYPPLVQGYSGPASPYWLAKAFLGLLLPADHPCWTEPEEPLPVERGDRIRALPVPGFLISATRADGVVRLLNHGSDNYATADDGGDQARGRRAAGRYTAIRTTGDPLYSRFAYSTATGPCHLADASPRLLADNHVALHHPELGLSRRTRIHRLHFHDHCAASWHQPAWHRPARQHLARQEVRADRHDWTDTEARIETASVVWGAFELRAHLVDAPPYLPLHDSGWQLAGDRPPRVRFVDHRAEAAADNGLTSTFVSLAGHTRLDVATAEGTSAFGRYTAVPYAVGRRATARTVHVALVGLTGRGADPMPPVVRCTVEGTTVIAGFPGGTWVVVALGAEPARSPTVGGVPLTGPVRYARVSPDEEPVIVRD
ncbi:MULTISPECIES: DUF2264 domain-containing protein [unclassified Streptomyces]|uniref:DUF2264 domain-containing protein n=1 Tax=unclassified Streptomyces TaxID=2593676 RepID=UPI00038201BE|nr:MULTISPECIES: DUF2264 domain-containing protein [unclassified Streptomyces]MYT32602.1 DUF2264 domain-containing protein [Streptomyces sp. SID8354]